MKFSAIKSRRESIRIISPLIKLSIIFLVGWILYIQVFQNNKVEDLVLQFNLALSQEGTWLYFLLAVCLVPLNWALESIKWKFLVKTFQDFSLVQSFEAILAGISMAIITPGRVGEYGGRLIGIRKRNRPKAIIANFISSLSQNIITVGIGMVGALIFVQKYMPLHQGIFASLLMISLIIISFMLILYFKIDLLERLLSYLPDWKWIKSLKRSIVLFQKLEHDSLFKILGISTLRYATFLTQYVLLIFFFGVTGDLLPAILGVVTIFFLQSNLPLPPALSVLARGEMAIFLWSVFTSNVLGVLAASFSLWIINLVIPAILGTVVISQAKIFDS